MLLFAYFTVYSPAFTVGLSFPGSTGVIIQWMRSDYAASEKEIVNLLFAVNKGALSNLVGEMP